ncbi:uncharacterized protein DUF4259 [Micromonospora pisi]|uniref:Uncharacterized protein DUF4259 n=1 Tax=Micromonospora pisi TaxID=589240 RepID=A0A495JB07_9ACTN|nr:DUF4259 domain-containing protein [Micromonospora pisi]RKR86196.1 uncharacterized protein DUF4259 [Micromonospora pisi]
MGFWDVGPFDNDDAADFAGDLDAATADARIEMVCGALDRVVTANVDIDMWHISKAVAAAALIAAQCPGGEAACPIYGPSAPMPQFPNALKQLAIDALDNVLAASSWRAVEWNDVSKGSQWRGNIIALRNVLDPPQRETLFEI